MKKRYEFSFGEISLVELSDIFGTLGVVGMLMIFAPIKTVEILSDFKWAFLLIALIFGIKPLRKVLSQEKKMETKPIAKKVSKGKKKK